MKEYDRGRLTSPLEAGTVIDPVTIPAGTEGIIVDAFPGDSIRRASYEVDFTLREPVWGPNDEVIVAGRYENATAHDDNLELVG